MLNRMLRRMAATLAAVMPLSNTMRTASGNLS
jgi:hypothetical protein